MPGTALGPKALLQLGGNTLNALRKGLSIEMDKGYALGDEVKAHSRLERR